MKEGTKLRPGMLVQLNPQNTKNKAFAGCIMVVSEPKSWGAQGYVQALGDTRDEPGGQAYYRATWETMEVVGDAEWVVGMGDVSFFAPYDRVAYLPGHAHGDLSHKDVEFGRVTSTNEDNVFVRFDGSASDSPGRACRPEDLRRIA